MANQTAFIYYRDYILCHYLQDWKLKSGSVEW